MSALTRAELRVRRHLRMRKKVLGTPERPRLAVFRSLNHIYCQVVDDTKGRTLLALCSLSPEIKKAFPKGGGNRAAAEMLGTRLAEKALKAGIQRVVFDRGGFRYHGRVLALADAARKGGLSL